MYYLAEMILKAAGSGAALRAQNIGEVKSHEWSADDARVCNADLEEGNCEKKQKEF